MTTVGCWNCGARSEIEAGADLECRICQTGLRRISDWRHLVKIENNLRARDRLAPITATDIPALAYWLKIDQESLSSFLNTGESGAKPAPLLTMAPGMRIVVFAFLAFTTLSLISIGSQLGLLLLIPTGWLGYTWFSPRKTYMDQMVKAANPYASPALLSDLAGSRRAEVRMQVALNPATDRITVEALAHDTDPEVADQALRRLEQMSQ